MPSLAETQAAQRRARGRVMAMAAIIQTGQPDSLVLLPPSSAGETRAVGERWPARVVWASDTRAARGLTCCRAAVCCADGVAEFTRQRAELAAIFALGTPSCREAASSRDRRSLRSATHLTNWGVSAARR
jgi:hypothetical protein